MADAPNKITITICGDGGCGKSSITIRLVRSQWIHEYDPTIEDSYSVTRTVDGVPYFLAITDTAGQEEYRGLWAASNLKSDAFLLVYDITNASSLSALDYFMEMIDIEAEQRVEDNQRLLKELGDSAQGLEVGMPPPVKIIAGNKCDLKEGRVVGAREGLEYARKHGCGFMETSAREMVNIEETFARMFHPFLNHFWNGSLPEAAGSSSARNLADTGQNKDAAAKSPNNKKGSRTHCLYGMSSRRKTPIPDQEQVNASKDAASGQKTSKSTVSLLLKRLSCW
ncbi:ras small monomeric GTPase [Aspergillus alliaceus]|uniref:Ras small monomeric GTPase n=1 Tax=Petromyces alliaceus TaxID=209559 RepID=A0A5N7CM96_PETAA|nr:ras small monomeric GTPase [Aspergillus alliaceus]